MDCDSCKNNLIKINDSISLVYVLLYVAQIDTYFTDILQKMKIKHTHGPSNI